MGEQTSKAALSWVVLLVEDDEDVRRQVGEYLSNEEISGRPLSIQEIPDLDKALNVIAERKADLLILDVFRGEARPSGERVGVRILERIKESGFAPVILYTALPEGLEEHESAFVRLVSKDDGGLESLRHEIDELFELRIPQLHRAVISHLDRTLSTYMWSFVLGNWADFQPFVDKKEFVRLVLQRLALAFSREGVEKLVAEIFSTEETLPEDPETVHPAECYVKPPIGTDPLLGDIRIRESEDALEYLVVLWPSCDMVTTGGRTPKTQAVLCAKAELLECAPEVVKWRENRTNTSRKAVGRLLSNRRKAIKEKMVGSEDRYHFLPGAWDIPNLVLDFQSLEYLDLNAIRNLRCLATLASPFAESLAARFWRYLGRIGTPDLNVELILSRLADDASDG